MTSIWMCAETPFKLLCCTITAFRLSAYGFSTISYSVQYMQSFLSGILMGRLCPHWAALVGNGPGPAVWLGQKQKLRGEICFPRDVSALAAENSQLIDSEKTELCAARQRGWRFLVIIAVIYCQVLKHSRRASNLVFLSSPWWSPSLKKIHCQHYWDFSPISLIHHWLTA